jgi:PIN domain nuclease of toxin-antitoxin system
MADASAVIDTAPLVAYLAGGRGSLGTAARRFLRGAESGALRVAVPTICLFEVGQLEERGRLKLGVPFERWCDLVEAAPALVVMSLERLHVSEARALPALRDPFDRLIAGTAVAAGLPLITRDARITMSGRVRVVW